MDKLTDKWWFWLAVGAVGVRAWETHCARRCLGPHPFAATFGTVGNLTNSVFELSRATCASSATVSPDATAGASVAPASTACCKSCGEGADVPRGKVGGGATGTGWVS
jgi:hypothetical protein